jgi:hypothetical protein
LQALVDKGASLNDIQEFLKGRNIQFSGSSGIRAAEQLPADFLKVLHTAKEGQTFLRSNPQGHTLLKVMGIRKLPVDEATASPAIRRFLTNQRVTETTAAELKALKETAKIEYVGTLAELPKTDASQRQTSGAPAAPLPALPQMDQLPIGTPAK